MLKKNTADIADEYPSKELDIQSYEVVNKFYLVDTIGDRWAAVVDLTRIRNGVSHLC